MEDLLGWSASTCNCHVVVESLRLCKAGVLRWHHVTRPNGDDMNDSHHHSCDNCRIQLVLKTKLHSWEPSFHNPHCLSTPFLVSALASLYCLTADGLGAESGIIKCGIHGQLPSPNSRQCNAQSRNVFPKLLNISHIERQLDVQKAKADRQCLWTWSWVTIQWVIESSGRS